MTVAMLMQNTLKSAERLWSLARERKVVPLELELLEKVPRCVSSHSLILFFFEIWSASIDWIVFSMYIAILRSHKLKRLNGSSIWQQRLVSNRMKSSRMGNTRRK